MKGSPREDSTSDRLYKFSAVRMKLMTARNLGASAIIVVNRESDKTLAKFEYDLYGGTLVQPLHVCDLARCCVRFCAQNCAELQPGVYFLGGPETVTLLDLVDMALLKLGRAKIKFHAPLFVLKLLAAISGKAAFQERVGLLFDMAHAEQNDVAKLLGPDQKLLTPSQTQEEILKAAAVELS